MSIEKAKNHLQENYLQVFNSCYSDATEITDDIARIMEEYYKNRIERLEEDIEKLKKHAQNENWSMVEIQAEKISYNIE